MAYENYITSALLGAIAGYLIHKFKSAIDKRLIKKGLEKELKNPTYKLYESGKLLKLNSEANVNNERRVSDKKEKKKVRKTARKNKKN
jgi:hypothetical protein